ncbi:hypothetical protein L917_20955 [Phytophthora nicotianae]|uniref:Uncharacterized protein n=1 Tax=Phytophthora nicotianae TaxID=4792 RepID=W2K0Y2_PHYNI|nr:hypothetical protein L915_21230 [Phytophthora nicotianae]ETL78204.1 hypothetical protein L917_20955 [Phytophthora nicotianae]
MFGISGKNEGPMYSSEISFEAMAIRFSNFGIQLRYVLRFYSPSRNFAAFEVS